MLEIAPIYMRLQAEQPVARVLTPVGDLAWLVTDGGDQVMANAAGDSRSVRTWTVALTSLAFFLVQISLLVVVTALPAIRHDLRASLSTLG